VRARIGYSKLSMMAESKSKDKVKIEIISVNQQNQTLSGKYLPGGAEKTLNIADLESKGADAYSSMQLKATVVGVHDFGVFAELDDYAFEGLIPTSRLPEGERPSSYAVGSEVTVQIEELNIAKKKMTLTMKSSSGATSGDTLAKVPPNKWLQGIVTSVSSFGIFVRPAGQDAVGLVHSSRIPVGLMKILKAASPAPAAAGNKTDIELVFSVGDVVKCRFQSYSAATKKLELAMVPKRNNDDEDVAEESDEDSGPAEEEEDNFDPEDTLLWWRGAPYKKTGAAASASADVDEEASIVAESDKIIEGTWRRMFEIDMREDASDFESKIQEAELKELEEEIGELGGLDEELIDSLGFGTVVNNKRMGSSISLSSVPEEWRKEMSFFKETENDESNILSRLKGGKKAEQEEFEKLLREVEVELEAASARRASRGPKDSLVSPEAQAANESVSSE